MFDGFVVEDTTQKLREIDLAWSEYRPSGRPMRRPANLSIELARRLGGEQNWICCNCRSRISLREHNQPDDRQATFRLLRPRSEGGTTHESNVALACRQCNTGLNEIWHRHKSEILAIEQETSCFKTP